MKYLIVFVGGAKTVVESQRELGEFCEHLSKHEFVVDVAKNSAICTKNVALVKKVTENGEK